MNKKVSEKENKEKQLDDNREIESNKQMLETEKRENELNERERELKKRISENLQKYARSQIHTLRIGATFSALETVAPTLPFDFQNKYPGVSLNIQTIPDGDLEPMVEREEIDCAFVIGPPDDPRRMYSLLLASLCS